MDNTLEATFVEYPTIELPEKSEWECELFGCGQDFVFTPNKGKEPNWFWRWMQYLAFGNKWVRKNG